MPKLKLSIDSDIDFFVAKAEVSIFHYEAQTEIRFQRKGTGTHPCLTQSSLDESIVEQNTIDGNSVEVLEE